MSVQSTRRTDGNSFKNTDKNSSAFASVASLGGILPRLRQISVFNRACKFLIRVRVVSAKSPELTSASLRKPGNIRLINSAHAASMARREGSVAAAARERAAEPPPQKRGAEPPRFFFSFVFGGGGVPSL